MKPLSKLINPRCELHSCQTLQDYDLMRSLHDSESLVNYTLDSMAHSMSRVLREKMTVSWSENVSLMAKEIRAKVYVFSEGDLVDFVNRVRADAQQDIAEQRATRRY